MRQTHPITHRQRQNSHNKHTIAVNSSKIDVCTHTPTQILLLLLLLLHSGKGQEAEILGCRAAIFQGHGQQVQTGLWVPAGGRDLVTTHYLAHRLPRGGVTLKEEERKRKKRKKSLKRTKIRAYHWSACILLKGPN